MSVSFQDVDDDDCDVYTRLQTSSLHRPRYANYGDASLRPRSVYDSYALPNGDYSGVEYQTVTFTGDGQTPKPVQSNTLRPPVILSSFT
jgi:hypothetical protein